MADRMSDMFDPAAYDTGDVDRYLADTQALPAYRPPSGGAPITPQGAAPQGYALPTVTPSTVEGRYKHNYYQPRFGASLSTPFAGGELTATGSYYQPPDTKKGYTAPKWGWGLQYRREF